MQESQILELGLPCSSLLAFQTSGETPPFPLNLSSTQVQEVCQKQPNTKHSQHRERESKLWEGTGLTSERATCKKFLPNYWECTGFLYKNVPVHIHVLKIVSLSCPLSAVLILFYYHTLTLKVNKRLIDSFFFLNPVVPMTYSPLILPYSCSSSSSFLCWFCNNSSFQKFTGKSKGY